LDDNDEPSKSATVKVWKREEYKAKDQKFWVRREFMINEVGLES
jgi:hypothetical protein